MNETKKKGEQREMFNCSYNRGMTRDDDQKLILQWMEIFYINNRSWIVRSWRREKENTKDWTWMVLPFVSCKQKQQMTMKKEEN